MPGSRGVAARRPGRVALPTTQALLIVAACAVSCCPGFPENEERAFIEGVAAKKRPADLRCWFFNTRTGESALLLLPSGRSVLIDCGTPSGGAKVARFLDMLNVDKLNTAVLSHPDFDHYGGFARLLERHVPDEFYHSGLESWTSSYQHFRRKLADAGCEVRAIRRGDTIDLGDGVACSVLWPPRDVGQDRASAHHANANSLVLKVRYGKVSLLFPGDLKSDSEAVLARDAPGEIKVDVLKVAHHGSASSSSREFLEAVRPRVSVVCGEAGNVEWGACGNASPRTLARIEEVGSATVRTCITGSLLVETDGREITTLETARGEVTMAVRAASPMTSPSE